MHLVRPHKLMYVQVPQVVTNLIFPYSGRDSCAHKHSEVSRPGDSKVTSQHACLDKRLDRFVQNQLILCLRATNFLFLFITFSLLFM